MASPWDFFSAAGITIVIIYTLLTIHAEYDKSQFRVQSELRLEKLAHRIQTAERDFEEMRIMADKLLISFPSEPQHNPNRPPPEIGVSMRSPSAFVSAT
ncbi:hypothetical protein F5Y14DRAFT_457459 [Nemania sp. NC0429]|nr:hypothetical protein F5Y14DRAFT_457459 [Nemania sp. NC0429]